RTTWRDTSSNEPRSGIVRPSRRFACSRGWSREPGRPYHCVPPHVMFTALSRALLRKIVKAPVVAYKPTVRGRAARLTLRAVAWVVLNLVVLEAATRVYFAAQ